MLSTTPGKSLSECLNKAIRPHKDSISHFREKLKSLSGEQKNEKTLTSYREEDYYAAQDEGSSNTPWRGRKYYTASELRSEYEIARSNLPDPVRKGEPEYIEAQANIASAKIALGESKASLNKAWAELNEMERILFSGYNVTHQFLTVPEKLAEFKESLAKEVNLEVSKFESHISWTEFMQTQKSSSDSVEKVASAPIAISAETKVNCGAGVPETSNEMNTSSPTSQLATVFHQPAHTSPHVSIAEVADTTREEQNPIDYAPL